MQAINAVDISKSFGHVKAVDDINFQVHSGEIVGLIGPNGAGKTTTIRMILDIFKPDSGRISVLGGSAHPAQSGRKKHWSPPASQRYS
ncbi:MAG: ATP-binding cassette domain-containing protein [Chloroflexi bacterium]|nr:ATP-binding cassette domain-containing protein [Chloroflexota bacterium]